MLYTIPTPIIQMLRLSRLAQARGRRQPFSWTEVAYV